ncbi:bifunctional DNA-binding transcriptional regulator/O6-methylguanine-DNA methyltransferase Ada [Terriglobus roseus]|uniref:methylated-DNA--[protein]-cysteine S-methyltransferase n=1 Tax=Terriglobus roseus TaxID=392734 RepID=A0A1H4QW19_9BACT|nr:bifunctional DNA-binding transcriptional regulator/O6-methylguanine-DNA methyltransferase Ada [Terriglobus roseus]SEC23860.1 AraC family transcriptional regulator, regulatory protein of adaptative response / methylated-DNA-[protein]-cysteine methyltransferase [Terriglobus roseus]
MATLSLFTPSFPPLKPMKPRDLAAPTHLASDEHRWLALLRRSNSAMRPDGAEDAFFYGVTTTGIVCRPSCPSRRPRRENTLFFDTVRQAEAAGFRTCQRCRPAGPPPEQEAAARIDIVRRYLQQHATEGAVTLQKLAEIAGLSPFHLQRIFRAAMGVSPAEYARRLRAERFADALLEGSVTEAVYAAGFQSASQVYAKRVADGMTPGARKRLGEHQHIHYSIVDSPLDRMLVAATDRGVCLIAFDTSDEVLREELRSRFAAAELEEDSGRLAEHARTVLLHLSESSTAKRLPLHVRATAFQQRVWKALEAIPHGETRTYAQLAAEIGSPKAVRAVGSACGANPVAPVVPCHRVVGSNGSLTGYRWGKERKAKLLEMEKGTGSSRNEGLGIRD